MKTFLTAALAVGGTFALSWYSQSTNWATHRLALELGSNCPAPSDRKPDADKACCDSDSELTRVLSGAGGLGRPPACKWRDLSEHAPFNERLSSTSHERGEKW
ncbi:MAG: hypothetical protein JO006_16460 [Paucibacter sp.]|nr:hypothetical protein [Roseateles sp.]